jgi:GrpB-like predicted nucleotidyltransferase (UPF0157 family)
MPGFTADAALSMAGWSGASTPHHTGPREPLEVPASVQIVDYDPRWPSLFEVEKHRLVRLLGHSAAAIEHFGSTSVPGICAKPCIDIVAGLVNTEYAERLQKILARLGYHHVSHSADGRWRIVGKSGSVAFRLHMVEYGDARWTKFLSLRDYLRTHSDVALDYCRQKRRLAALYRMDSRRYQDVKHGLVKSLEAAAQETFL